MSDNLLQIYVSKSCWGHHQARKIAYQMRVEYADLCVEFVVREQAHDWPDTVIATPAYVLNDKLVSLGNPALDDLRDRLDAAYRDGST